MDDAKADAGLGWFLKIWLGLMVAAGLWVAFRIGMQIEDLVSHFDPRWRQGDLRWALPVLLACAVLQSLGAGVLLFRYRIGLYIFAAAASAAFVVNTTIGVPLTTSAVGVLGLVVLVILARRQWQALR